MGDSYAFFCSFTIPTSPFDDQCLSLLFPPSGVGDIPPFYLFVEVLGSGQDRLLSANRHQFAGFALPVVLTSISRFSFVTGDFLPDRRRVDDIQTVVPEPLASFGVIPARSLLSSAFC